MNCKVKKVENRLTFEQTSASGSEKNGEAFVHCSLIFQEERSRRSRNFKW